MNILLNMKKYILAICVIYFLITLCVCPNTTASVPVIDHAKILNSKGYPTDTTEQIIEATKSKSYFIRYVALILLTERTGKKAIPELRKGLNDERMEVRWRAAHLLGTLGDKVGLERMREDLKHYAPNSGASITPDPNVQDQMRESEQKKNLRLYYGLHAAKVLAELNDRRGYELAVRMALTGEWAAQRSEAIRVLVEIAKTEKETLAKEKIDPVSDLCAIAQFEKVRSVFRTLTSSVEELGRDSAVQILETAINSPHQSELMRNVAKRRLERVRAKMKAAENKPKDSK